MAELLITLFFGWMGAHKFMKGNVSMGLIYLFTFGLFGIGWFVDIVLVIKNTSKNSSNQTKLTRTTRTSNRNHELNSFDIAGIEYRTNDVIPIMKKGNPEYSKFVYRIKEDYAILIPEPDNEYDPNAIAVYVNNTKVGYVPRVLTSEVKPLIGKYNFIATIRGGDVYGERGIIERDFYGEVRIIK